MRQRLRVISMVFSVVVVGLILPCLSRGQSPEAPQGIERLEEHIRMVIEPIEGDVGVSVKHIESGEELHINGETYFPMASVFKVPIFVEVMAQVKEGKLHLEDEISLGRSDQHLGSGMLSSLDAPGITLSVRNLINLMMMISDNSATDILLKKVGPENVTKRLRSFGLENITVNRTCQHLIMDFIGMDYEKYKDLPLDEVTATFREDREQDPESFERASKAFSRVIKDQSTPSDMNRLLELIFTKEILDEESCDHILKVMMKCQTGERRLKGDLPSWVKVAHKTGTIGGTVNDAGIIFLPHGLGHVAITVFTKDTEAKTREIEDIIAQISRFVYDYFTFTAAASEDS
ncbi:MAG: serine hydrolase [Candidatus Aminicenantales bacterium]